MIAYSNKMSMSEAPSNLKKNKEKYSVFLDFFPGSFSGAFSCLLCQKYLEVTKLCAPS